MRLLCRIFGHKYDEGYMFYYNKHYCDRCQSEMDDYQEGWSEKVWDIFEKACDKLNDVMVWFKCPECGLRFGKHNEDDHIPF